MKRMNLLGPFLLLLAPLPLVIRAEPAIQDALKPSDHQALGKALAEYVEAGRKNKGADKARTAIAADLQKIRKKLKDRDPLSLTSDLGKAMWEAYDYASARNVAKGKVKEVSFKDAESEFDLTYAVWGPSKYDPKKAYPVIFCVGDKGEKPSDHLTEKWVSPDTRDNAVLVGVPMPSDDSLWSEVGSQGKWGGAAHLFTVYREVTRAYATDFDRVYIAGRGVGVPAVVAIAARSPDRFAGVIGRSGDPGDTPHENFKNLPTFFAGAGAGATAFSEKCAKAGYDNCILKPEGVEADVWAWIQDHPRISNPSEVVLVPGTQIGNKAYWLEVPPWDGQGTAMVRGKIDRASNTIEIDGEGVTKVSLYFNDVLVDLDKPVKVLCNGSEHMALIPRNLSTMLDLFVKTRSDPGKLYVATQSYDLPAKPKPK